MMKYKNRSPQCPQETLYLLTNMFQVSYPQQPLQFPLLSFHQGVTCLISVGCSVPLPRVVLAVVLT